jgi:cyclic-di-GMP-binding biofilm dispersal mediator protein
MGDFTGKNILVLGGSRGIGAAIVRRFARSGGKVAFTYAGSKETAEALAGETRAVAIRTDSADRDALIATVASRGALDVRSPMQARSLWAIR